MAERKSGRRATTKAAQDGMKIVNSAQHIWLAGLGAIARAQKEGPKLFESLVNEGSEMQERTRDTTQRIVSHTLESVRGAVDTRVGDMRDRASEAWDDIEKIFQARVQQALRQLGVPTSHEINALSRKVSELTRSVEALRTSKARRPAGTRARARAPRAAAHAAPHSAS